MPSVSKKSYIAAVLFAAAVFFLSTLSAFADSYQTSSVMYTQSDNFYGIDSAGDYVVDETTGLSYMNDWSCGGAQGASACYATYYAGQAGATYSTSAPALSYDNGTSCTAMVSGATLSGVCNGSFGIFGGEADGENGIWMEDGSTMSFLMYGAMGGGFINSSGDAVLRIRRTTR